MTDGFQAFNQPKIEFDRARSSAEFIPADENQGREKRLTGCLSARHRDPS
jgi:hypothetical protein